MKIFNEVLLVIIVCLFCSGCVGVNPQSRNRVQMRFGTRNFSGNFSGNINNLNYARYQREYRFRQRCSNRYHLFVGSNGRINIRLRKYCH